MLNCSYCLENKSSDCFFENRQRTRGFSYVCKTCCASTKYKKRNKWPQNRWNYENCLAVALKCSTFKEFVNQYKATYDAAKNKGFLDEIMLKAKLFRKYALRGSITKEVCANAAKLYKTRVEFSLKAKSYYSTASKRGWLDDICTHMMHCGSLALRGIYAFEYPDKSVYVGLTYDYKRRYADHMYSNTLLIKKFKQGGQVFRTFNEFYPPHIAQIEEANTIEKYRSQGWTILNKRKAGALGGNKKWTEKAIRKEALKYQYKNDFARYACGAKNAAYKAGILEDVCAHMPFRRPRNRENKIWTKESVREEALKYEFRMEFRKNSSSAYKYAQREGILKEICSHMAYQSLRKWTNAELTEEAKKYNHKSDFAKHNMAAYAAALRYEVLDKICSHMPKYRKDWTNAELTEEAKKYNDYTEFWSNSKSAYQVAYRRGILEEITAHMHRQYKKRKLTNNKISDIVN